MILRAMSLFILMNLIFLNSCSQAQTAGENELTVIQVQEKINSQEDIVLLDVRTGEEYTGPLGHIDSSLIIPLGELEARMGELEKYKEYEIIVICHSGNRSAYATRILLDNDFKAYNMLGGMIKWNNYTEQQKEDN